MRGFGLRWRAWRANSRRFRPRHALAERLRCLCVVVAADVTVEIFGLVSTFEHRGADGLGLEIEDPHCRALFADRLDAMELAAMVRGESRERLQLDQRVLK